MKLLVNIADKEKKSFLQDRLIGKHVFSNYYNQDVSSKDIIYYSENSVILAKYENYYRRLFVISNDLQDLGILLNSIPKDKYVLNYPAKNDINNIIKFLGENSFFHVKTYLRIYNTQVKKRGKLENIQFATINDLEQIKDLFKNEFVDFIAHLPDDNGYLSLINRNNIVVNRVNGVVKGAFMFEFQGKKCYFKAWVDKNNNGIKLLFDVYTIMADKNVKNAYFWVDSENYNVIRIHKLFGAKEDGLKDYIFINNEFR